MAEPSEVDRLDEPEVDGPAPRAGDRLGRFELRGVLGVGAMGRVFRGFDPTLGREVAIKALVDAWGDEGSEERRRFEREARLLATLNHPNIAAIYGWELIDGAPYLVLELVEGQTLAERLDRGPLPVAEAVTVALQLAGALEEAHRKGVVHRDLKPSNVKLDLEGRVKVVDFGIAKALAPENERPAGAGAPTTEAGAILGTAPYMSPEQVRAEPVDTRSDVWAFGCLLYEMLSGRRAFGGASPAEVLAAVLRDDPDWNRLPAALPAGLRRLLRRCLRRDRRQRLNDIGDARLELTELGTEDEATTPVRPAPRPPRTLLVATLVAALLAVLALTLPRLVHRSAPAPVARLSLELPAQLTLASDFAAPFAVSPDGSHLAVLALDRDTPRLYLRRMDGIDLVAVPGTEGAWQPSFSADGRSLLFFADRKLKRVSLPGGPVVDLAETGANPRGVSGSPDGAIVLAASSTAGLARVDAGGSALRPLSRLDLARGEGSHRWPQVLPGGRWALFTCGVDGAPFDDAHLDVISLETGERRRLWSGGSYGRYAAGRLFFLHAGRLHAAPFDLDALAVRGTPEVVIEGVRDDPRNGAAHFAVAEGGPLLYGPAAPRSTESYLAWVDAAGSLTRIEDTPRQFREPRLSPDGRRVAARIGTEAASDLWVFDTETATLTRASARLAVHRPVWTPDGRGITVSVDEGDRWKIVTLQTRGGPAATVSEGPERVYPNSWSPDGRSLVFQERRAATGWDLRVLDVGADGRPLGAARDLAATPFHEVNASVSADGRLVAYDSDEPDNVFAVYVAPLHDPAARVRAASMVARWPRWGPGGQLYCWFPIGARPGESKVPEGVHRIDWSAGGAPPRAVALWGGLPGASSLLRRLAVAPYANYDLDVSERGPRFLVLEASNPGAETPLRRPVVVLNWLQGLGARAARP